MPSLTQRVMAELRADKKRTAILTVLTLVALFLGGRLVFRSAGPAELGAAAGEGLPPDAQADTASAPGLRPLKRPSVPADRPGRPLQWHSQRPSDGSVLRDLFAYDLRSYVRTEPEPAKPASPGQRVPDMVEIEKAVRAQAKTLILQSTMVGPDSSAVINGQVLRVGQHIAGFRIVRIHARSCDVEKQGVEVRLVMKK